MAKKEMTDRFREFLKNLKTNTDVTDSLIKVCAFISENRDQVIYLYKYSCIPSLIQFLNQPNLRSASLCIISYGCLEQKFFNSFLKHFCVEKLVQAIDSSWNDFQLNAACLILFRIYKCKLKYPRRHDKNIARIIPRIILHLEGTNDVESQLTVCRLFMILHRYPFTKESISKQNGCEVLIKLLTSPDSELQMNSFRTLVNFIDFGDSSTQVTGGRIHCVLFHFLLSAPESFQVFAFFCFIEVSLQKDITEYLVHSGFIVRIFDHIMSHGSLVLKRITLVSLRHFLLRLCKVTSCEEEMEKFSTVLKKVIHNKADDELHIAIASMLHDLSFFGDAYEIFEEILLDMLRNYTQKKECQCALITRQPSYAMPWFKRRHKSKEMPYDSTPERTIKGFPELAAHTFRTVCVADEDTWDSSHETFSTERKNQRKGVHVDCISREDSLFYYHILTCVGDRNEVLSFPALVSEYTSVSHEVKHITLDLCVLRTVLRFLQLCRRLREHIAMKQFTRNTPFFDVMVEYAFLNPSHCQEVYDIFSFLFSGADIFLLIISGFIVKVEDYVPTGIRFADATCLADRDKPLEMHSTYVQKFLAEIQLKANKILHKMLSFLTNCGESEEQLVILHAVSALASDASCFRNVFDEQCWRQVLIPSLSEGNSRIQRMAAVAVSEVCKFITASSPSSFRVSKAMMNNWRPHTDFSPCCHHSLVAPDNAVDNIEEPECCYTFVTHDVQFSISGDNGFVGANRELVCENSEYFKHLLKGDFRESEASIIPLKDIMMSTLVIIFHHLHGCQLNSSCHYASNLSLLQKLDLLINCEFFLLDDLKPIAEELLCENLCYKNIPLIYEYSKTCNSPTLTKITVEVALCILYHSDYWSCFQELVRLDSKFNFIQDVQCVMTEILKRIFIL